MKKSRLLPAILGLCLAGATAAASQPAEGAAERHVVVISVDGLRPDFYLNPSAHGVELPNFQELMREGAFAEGVEGSYPSVTYPSHTTMMTGARPRRHGILNNYVFDPKGLFVDWYWHADAIKVPTLWDVAEKAGGTTAALQWPVTAGAPIDLNFPEFWIPGSRKSWRQTMAEVMTPELLVAVESELGRLPDQPLRGEALESFVFEVAGLILKRFRPQLLLLHVIRTDSTQHDYGREHPAVAAAFEGIDGKIGSLRRTLEESGLAARTLLVVTGDHGFIQIHSEIHLNTAFQGAGLLDVGEDGKVSHWRALAWPSGGSCAVMLKDGNDSDTRRRVETLVDEMLKGPLGGAMYKVSRQELDRLGAMPDALFALEAREGYIFGKGLEGEILTPSENLGFHGFLPHRPRMRTGFLMVGPGVRAGVRVPVMRQIDLAPTIAAWAGWELLDTDGLVLRGLFEEGALER
ncbi:MAG: alkaline phosphatase family protein [Acidobacteriota bacterium]